MVHEVSTSHIRVNFDHSSPRSWSTMCACLLIFYPAPSRYRHERARLWSDTSTAILLYGGQAQGWNGCLGRSACGSREPMQAVRLLILSLATVGKTSSRRRRREPEPEPLLRESPLQPGRAPMRYGLRVLYAVWLTDCDRTGRSSSSTAHPSSHPVFPSSCRS